MTEEMITKIMINIVNAFLVPIVLPIFLNVINREREIETSTDTLKLTLDKFTFFKIKKVYDDKTPFYKDLPSAYFANLVWAVVYMYGENFRTPFLVFYYVLIVLCLIYIVFLTRDFSKETKFRSVVIIGIILSIFSLLIIFGPLKRPEVYYHNYSTENNQNSV